MQNPVDTIVVGAGVAGLSCARRLQSAGLTYQVIEAGDSPGGRIRTDSCDGFLLDRGFQVLLTAYPEARRALNYERLSLRHFYPGALVRFAGAWHRVADPLRRPIAGALSSFNPIGSFADKLRIGRLRFSGARHYATGAETDTLSVLRNEGFSDAMIERFLRPFLGGVFLERELRTTARKFASVWRHFAAGDIAVPAKGMEQIPRQLAESLPGTALRLKTRVESINSECVRLSNGDELTSDSVVIATDAAEAYRLLGEETDTPTFNRVICLYFAASKPPIQEPILALNGDGKGPINNLAVMSQVSPHYAPEGKSLVSVTVLQSSAANSNELEREVRSQLQEWFGAEAGQWSLLRRYQIQQAVPLQTTSTTRNPRIRKGLYLCGDHCGLASLDSALSSGHAAAARLLKDRNA